MCGLAGLYSQVDFSESEKKIRECVLSLRHRGPNDSGVEAFPLARGHLHLGHTRLSILDLSKAGHQPMSSEDERYWIVFNGEIYNYKEIRGELEQRGCCFKSNSDTEVLLNAWIEWGVDCLQTLVGMFSFVVFDNTERSLICVRDAFGIKPFYYMTTDNQFCFASEVSSLILLGKQGSQVNWERAYDYLAFGSYDHTEDTFFKDVQQLKPGHLISVKLEIDEPVRQQRWWWPNILEDGSHSFSTATSILRDKFLRSIRLHLRSDVPVGVAVSGGIDSSAIACAIRHIEPEIPIHTFSFIAPDTRFNEANWSSLVNSAVNAIPHLVQVSRDELLRDLDCLIRTQGEPFGGTSIYAQYQVYKCAKENGITVVLDGQGADELLAGYEGFPAERITSFLDENRYLSAINFLSRWSRTEGGMARSIRILGKAILPSAMRHLLINNYNCPKWLDESFLQKSGIQTKRQVSMSSMDSKGRRMIARLRDLLVGNGLPALLRHADRNSMHWSIESRVPFLSTDLSAFLLSLPEKFLYSDDGTTKAIFREAMRGIVPDIILNRRDKVGFTTPEEDLLTGISLDSLGTIDMIRSLPIFNEASLQAFRLKGEREVAFTSADKWRILNFSRWMQLFSINP